jgi:hypothetical protein
MPISQLLNVDLDIYSRFDLEPLISAFGNKVVVLHQERLNRTFQAHFELATNSKTADSAILKFCRLVDGLRGDAKELWHSASKRDLNIGVQVELQPLCFELALSVKASSAAAKLNAHRALDIRARDFTDEKLLEITQGLLGWEDEDRRRHREHRQVASVARTSRSVDLMTTPHRIDLPFLNC